MENALTVPGGMFLIFLQKAGKISGADTTSQGNTAFLCDRRLKNKMKKRSLLFLGLILLTAAAVELTTQLMVPLVTDTDDILEQFYEARTSLPPVPSPVDYKTVVTQLSEDRADFLSSPYWGFTHTGGTLYLSDKSELKLDLPMQLVAYEDLESGKVVLSGTPIGTKKIQTLAIVDAPEFSAYDGKTSLDTYLMNELWPRRIIWTAELRSEEDATLLSMIEQSLLLAEDTQTELSLPMTMPMTETITDFRLIQNETNRQDLSVYAPPEFVGATVDLLCSTNLVEGVWDTVLQTNVASTGMLFLAMADIPSLIYVTNVTSGWVDCPECAMTPGAVCTNQTWVVSTNQSVVGGGLVYFRASANSLIDTDSDGLDNVSEYGAGTDFQDIDSDEDGLLDGEEVDSGQDPLTANSIPDEFATGMQSASNGVFVVLPERCWHAQESSLNLETYGAYGE